MQISSLKKKKTFQISKDVFKMEELHTGNYTHTYNPHRYGEGTGPAAPAMRLELETQRRQAMWWTRVQCCLKHPGKQGKLRRCCCCCPLKTSKNMLSPRGDNASEGTGLTEVPGILPLLRLSRHWPLFLKCQDISYAIMSLFSQPLTVPPSNGQKWCQKW